MTFTEEDFAAPQFTEADFADQPAKFTEADFADKSRALTPDQLDAIIKRSQPERFNSFGDEAGVRQDDLLREVVNNPGKVIATPFKIAGNLPLAIGADAMNAVVGPGLPFTQTRKTNLEAGETAGAINTENPLENIKAALRGDNLPVEETISRLPVGQRLPVGIVTGLTKAAPKIASLALFPEALPAQMAASGALFGLDDEGNFSVKEAGLMALLPGVSAAGRLAVGKTIAKGVEAGVGGLENAAVQKALTIGGDQAVMNGYMLAM